MKTFDRVRSYCHILNTDGLDVPTVKLSGNGLGKDEDVTTTGNRLHMEKGRYDGL